MKVLFGVGMWISLAVSPCGEGTKVQGFPTAGEKVKASLGRTSGNLNGAEKR